MGSMSKRLLRRASVLLIALLSWASSYAGHTIEKNVVYGMYSGLALLMDVYRPDAPNGIGLVVIPGSGWEAPLDYSAEQLKESYELQAIFGIEPITNAGYTAFVINHRATPRFKYPAPIEDAQRAVRFIRYHAETYGIDPARIGAVGGSSGGHLASLLGTLNGDGRPDDSDPINQQSAKVQAVVAVYPAVDFLAFETSNPWAGGAITSLLGPVNPAWKPPPLQNPSDFEIYKQASPTSHVSADDSPFLLIHGDADSVVPFEQSELMKTKLENAGVEAILIRIPEGDHGPGLIQNEDYGHIDKIVHWLDSHMLREP
jgi:acetyl esterase/lipase